MSTLQHALALSGLKCDFGKSNNIEDFKFLVFFSIIEDCKRPDSGCTESYDVYKSVDCDGDGILDHACSTTVNNNHWLVLSTEGCPNTWGTSARPPSKCAEAFQLGKR